MKIKPTVRDVDLSDPEAVNAELNRLFWQVFDFDRDAGTAIERLISAHMDHMRRKAVDVGYDESGHWRRFKIAGETITVCVRHNGQFEWGLLVGAIANGGGEMVP